MQNHRTPSHSIFGISAGLSLDKPFFILLGIVLIIAIFAQLAALPNRNATALDSAPKTGLTPKLPSDKNAQ
jgi:hypothetical protein